MKRNILFYVSPLYFYCKDLNMNVGKKFEQQFYLSVPADCFVYRLKDSSQSFIKETNSKFSWDNPCDFFLFDTRNQLLYCLELKTTCNKSISFENIDSNEERKKMIHKHQIKSLLKFSDYKNVVAGFVFNFRDKNNDTERTYFQEVSSFYSMSKRIQKQSFNEVDLLLNDCVKIAGEKKRVNYRWDIKIFR